MSLTIGYIASALLAASLMMNNAVKFRWLNLSGCTAFIIYGVLIEAFPVIIANSILLCINIVQTVKLYSAKEVFQMVPVTSSDKLVEKFLSFYHHDIQKYFPHFSFHDATPGNQISFVVLRDLSIANIFVARIAGDGSAIVEINYTVPKYRDFKIGRFIFEKEKEYLLLHSIKSIVYEKVFNKNHKRFIKVMGFVAKTVNEKERYVKDL